MPCYRPLRAWRSKRETHQGKRRLVFSAAHGDGIAVPIPCGSCIGCRLERSRQWAIRVMHEASLYTDNSFVSLTYRDESLPERGVLVHRDFQLFAKRLRKFYGRERISYFMCGEYGEEKRRPHYHAALFGVWFPDQVFRKNGSDGSPLYQSATLDRLWKQGECLIGALTFESAAYIARYCTKKIDGEPDWVQLERVDPETGEVYMLPREYMRCSTNPAIGERWYERFGAEVRASDAVVARGFESKPPRFYDKLHERFDAADWEVTRYARQVAGASDEAWANSKPSRLKVREQVKLAQFKQLKRTTL